MVLFSEVRLEMKISGRATKYGDDVDTDVIIPAKYLIHTDPKQLAMHAMEGIDPDFGSKIRTNSIIVAGKNFGCGSSREHAPIALKEAGVKAIVAESFARIFFRNSIDLGMPVVECKNISSFVEEGDTLDIDLRKGTIINSTKNVNLECTKYPAKLLEVVEKGGLVGYLKSNLAGK